MKLKRVSSKGLRIKGTNQRGMSRSELNKLLCDVPTWNSADEDARRAFAMMAREVRYGYEPLRSAWDWFLLGWKAQAAAVGARG